MGLLSLEPNEVFPTKELLDHIPTLIREVADCVRRPKPRPSALIRRFSQSAQELGALRHSQQASVHQLLAEYRLLGGILTTFVQEELARLDVLPTAEEAVEVMRRLNDAIWILTQTTVDTFVTEYTVTIASHAARLETSNRMFSHELRQPLSVRSCTRCRLCGPRPVAAILQVRTLARFDGAQRSPINPADGAVGGVVTVAGAPGRRARDSTSRCVDGRMGSCSAASRDGRGPHRGSPRRRDDAQHRHRHGSPGADSHEPGVERHRVPPEYPEKPQRLAMRGKCGQNIRTRILPASSCATMDWGSQNRVRRRCFDGLSRHTLIGTLSSRFEDRASGSPSPPSAWKRWAGQSASSRQSALVPASS